MTRASMTRIHRASFRKTLAAWLVLGAAAWPRLAAAAPARANVSSEHAPPPVLAIETPPPPELLPRDWERRPLELSGELALGFPNCAPGNVNNARCSGLSAGAGLGVTALWRVSPYFAWGGELNAVGFTFSPPHGAGLRDARAGGVFVGVLGRIYLLERGAVDPYLELGLGAGGVGTSAREADSASYRETAAGAAARVGLGVELYLGDRVRLGPALTWTRFRKGQLTRCGAGDCVDLDGTQNGHGVGFTTLSLRVTLLAFDPL